jgi:hypothetical protein
MFFYLIDIAILVGFAGLIFIIIGIVKKKPGQWIPGIALTVIATLLIVYAFARVINRTSNVIDRFSRWEKKYSNKLEQILPDTTIEEKTHYDTVYENNKMKVRLYKGNDIAGFINGTDNKLTLIKIKLSKALKSKGVSIDKIEEYSLKRPVKNLIPLRLCFSKDFKSKITLTAYGQGKNEISSSTISCSALKGEEKNVVFEFEKSLKLSDIDYCIIYDSTQ